MQMFRVQREIQRRVVGRQRKLLPIGWESRLKRTSGLVNMLEVSWKSIPFPFFILKSELNFPPEFKFVRKG